MRWGAIATALMALASTGCLSKGVEVEIDDSFTPEEKAAIVSAGQAWDAFAGSHVVTFVPKGEWLIARAEVPDGHYGLAQGRRHMIRVDTAAPSAEVYAVALHELGHALGVQHTSQGVMDPLRQTTTFSQADREECIKAGVCPDITNLLRFRSR